MSKVLVIHGPNLNLLGTRETSIYGDMTLVKINELIIQKGTSLGCQVETFQFNHEGEVVEAIGSAAAKGYVGILLNPAAYTHTSIAILDALRATDLPVIEVHLSNIHAREEYRRKSVTAEGAKGIISGFGPNSYLLGLEALSQFLKQ